MNQKKSKCFFIIKPEAWAKREEIKRCIENESGLKIIDSKTIVLSKDDVDVLYRDDTDTDLMLSIKKHLIGQTVEVGIVEGENAVEVLDRICGHWPDPKDCAKGTIRRNFSNPQPIELNGRNFFLNAIHKASLDEVKIALEWFSRL